MGRLIRDGNQVYEIDEECIRERERKERDRQTKESEKQEEYSRQTGNRYPAGR